LSHSGIDVKRAEKICRVVDLGLIAYATACELQRQLVGARKADVIPDVLLFCEHPHVITLGRNAKQSNLLASKQLLAQRNVELEETDRGGDITYHGPGQVVGYPILDLTQHRDGQGRDVRWYVEQLEEVMIRATANFGLEAKRSSVGHGVWLDGPTGEEKLGALGVHLSRWVTSHGFAYNVATDLRYFDLMIPCGIAGKRATSLERALGRAVDAGEARERLRARFGEVFGVELVSSTRREVEEALASRQVTGDAPIARAEVGAEMGSEV
jgi:lipoyl(octanoyl) transferase